MPMTDAQETAIIILYRMVLVPGACVICNLWLTVLGGRGRGFDGREDRDTGYG